MSHPVFGELRENAKLPTPTGVALEILRLTNDDGATIEALVSVIERDPALAGRLLKLVNSPLAGLNRTVTAISTAARMLGLRTVRNLALGFSLVSSNRSGRCRHFDYSRFWSRSLGRAVAARVLAQEAKSAAPDEVFAVGLLSDIGRLALATAFAEKYGDLLERSPAVPDSELRARETAAFRIDHRTLSAEMMADWGVQSLFCEAVVRADDEELWTAESEIRRDEIARLLSVAAACADVLAEAEVSTTTIENLTNRSHALGIPDDRFPSVYESIRGGWLEAASIFSIEASDGESLEVLREEARRREIALESMAQADHETASRTTRSDSLRLLVVDDDAAVRRLLEQQLRKCGYDVFVANDGLEALRVDQIEAPQMIITDWMMPNMDGVQLCRRLRSSDGNAFVYIIILTAQAEKDRAVEALNAGADDFLAKPYSPAELIARVRAGERIVQLESNLARRTREVSTYAAQLAAANEQLQAMATTDELTGLLNRRAGLARLDECWALGHRYNDSIACIVCDVDHFKRVNDTHGHTAGDCVLRAIARVMRESVRAGEIPCRVGGEEFLVICPKATAADARQAAERLRACVEQQRIDIGGDDVRVTISLGVAECTPAMKTPDEVYAAADCALYEAKAGGRNRVCVAGQSAPAPVASS